MYANIYIYEFSTTLQQLLTSQYIYIHRSIKQSIVPSSHLFYDTFAEAGCWRSCVDCDLALSSFDQIHGFQVGSKSNSCRRAFVTNFNVFQSNSVLQAYSTYVKYISNTSSHLFKQKPNIFSKKSASNFPTK